MKAWIVEPSEHGAWDEFLLKQYNSWLVPSEVMIPLLEQKMKEHEKRQVELAARAEAFRAEEGELTSDNPLFSTVAVIEMGVSFERGYAEWCSKMLGWLKENRI